MWSLLRAIPFGETVTYGELAVALGERTSVARGVGRAVAHNPLSIVVPCHRVVGKNGELRGYAGGLERKRFLLDLEGAGQLSLGLLRVGRESGPSSRARSWLESVRRSAAAGGRPAVAARVARARADHAPAAA